MNYLQRVKTAYKALQLGYDMPLIQKTLNDPLKPGEDRFRESLYRYLNQDMPTLMPDNASDYISKGYINADIYSIVNYRANLQKNIPWKLYQRKGNSKEEWDIIQEHELLDTLDTLDLLALSIYEDTIGNAYVYAPFLMAGMNKGKAKELSVLKGDLVTIISGGSLQPVKGYRYSIDLDQARSIDADDVLHLKLFTPDSDPQGSLYGMSPLRAAVRQIAISNDGSHALSSAFKNQGIKSIVFAKDDEHSDWTAEQSKNLETAWKRKNGPGKYGDVVFNSKELGKIDLGLSPVELETLKGLQFNFKQLCNIYDGFPTQLLNDNESSTFNNLDSADKRVYTNCVIPKRARWRDALNKWLTPRYGDNLWLDFDTSDISVLQNDRGELATWLDKAWWVKGIDKQKMLGVPEDPLLDGYFLPMGLQFVKDINDLSPQDTDIEEAIKHLKERGVNEYE
jgi:HK97 family phage portal protein